MKNLEILKEVHRKIEYLVENSYHVQCKKLDEYVLEFFNIESKKLREKEIYLNYNGFKQKITKIGYDYSKVLHYNYEESVFKSFKVKNIPGCMPRIDQLVWFQENIEKISSEVLEHLYEDRLSQANFWIYYAQDANWLFLTDLNSTFSESKFKFRGGIKTNL